MFSFSGHAEVLADLPPFHDDNLGKYLILRRINQCLSKSEILTQLTGPVQSSMRRASNRIEPLDERTTWAQAEMFIVEKLSNGYEKEQLEIMIEQEREVDHDNGDFDPLFLRYCLRILRNMCDTSQLPADVPQTARAHDGHSMARDGPNRVQAKPKDPTNVSLASSSRKDNNAAEQMGMPLIV